jgi:hypothetical protein
MIQTNMKNAIETIRESYTEQIEILVQKEVERVANILSVYNDFRTKFSNEIQDYAVYRTILIMNGCNDELANVEDAKGHNWYTKYAYTMTYGRRQRLQDFVFGLVNRYDKTFASHIESVRAISIAKLESALEKFLTSEDMAEVVSTHIGGKGFEVNSRLADGRFFYTCCVPCGGYNIQEFHYRYIAKMLKK